MVETETLDDVAALGCTAAIDRDSPELSFT
jgi:hypothetical protein